MSRARPFALAALSLPLAALLLAAPAAVAPARADGTVVRQKAVKKPVRQARVLTVRASVARAVPAERRVEAYTGVPGPCADPRLLGKIQSRFAHKESHYWNSPLEIVAFERIRETSLRPWSVSHIPRRYCEARVLTNDKVWRHASYNIGENLGFAGYGDGVEFCVAGTDRNFAYAPGCKTARP